MEETFAEAILFLCGLIFLASVVYYMLKKIKFPFTIGLVIVGLPLGFLINDWEFILKYKELELTPPIIFYVLLPALIFAAAVEIDGAALKKYILPILALAIPGVVIATLLTGGLVALLTPVNLGAALLFGALISATDPVAVVAIFEELNVSKKLSVLVDGESIFNDATAIVAFHTVLAVVVGSSGESIALGAIVLNFLFVCIGGCVIGGLIAWLMSHLIRLARSIPVMGISFSLIAAYSSYIIAERYCDVSGVMAVLVCGLYLKNKLDGCLDKSTTEHLKHFWGYLTFVANSLIFLLLGMGESRLLTDLPEYLGVISYFFVIILVVTVARAVIVYGLVPISNRLCKGSDVTLHYRNIIFWGGLRGAIPLALVISIPHSYEYRTLLIDMTLTVVLFTIMVQGTTIKRLIRKGD